LRWDGPIQTTLTKNHKPEIRVVKRKASKKSSSRVTPAPGLRTRETAWPAADNPVELQQKGDAA
jgi:hypothetical protein